MICNYCQSEIDENTKFCPVCGAPVAPPADKAPDYFSQSQVSYQTPVNPQANPYAPEFAVPQINPLLAKTDMLVKDNLFLAVCILQSVAAALPLFGEFKGFSVITILVSIFLWIIYSDSKKGLPNPMHIRLVSGTIFAYKVVLYVVCGLLAFMGVLCFFSASPFVKLFTDAFSEGAQIDGDFERIFSMGGWIIGISFIIAAALIFVLTFFSYGKMHKFVKSCYENILGDRNALENRNITSVWLIVFAVIMGLGALCSIAQSPFYAITVGAQTATCILSYILLKKYYIEYN